MSMGWHRVARVSRWTIALAISGCGDDEGGSGSGSGSGSEASSADSGSSATTVVDEGSASGSQSGSGSSAESASTTASGGCCGIPECGDGVGAGDSCAAVPCCAGETPLLCDDLQCGSQSCVGTLVPSSCSDCALLQQHMSGLFQLAVMCDPANDQCVVSETLTDVCGCMVAISGESPVLDDLQQAYDVWVAQGCGPMGCGAPCPVGEASCLEGNGTYCGFGP
jgi:hypothetical protein